MSTNPDIIVVGGGLAGLACSRRLVRAGLSPLLLEGSDRVGGRIRTDEVEGFRLDRGFQVFLTSYPEARRVLDYDALELRPFLSGARVRIGGTFHNLADPWRRPGAALASLGGPVGSLADKARVARLRARLLATPPDELFDAPDRSTRQVLREEGFSEDFVHRFFRPFLGGVFLDPELTTSRRMRDFVFHMFSAGEATLPATGMEAIPRQLADALPGGTVRTGARVRSVEPDAVVLESGERLRAEAVVVATDGAEAARLVEEAAPGAMVGPSFNGTTCMYFAAPEDPVGEPVLVLNGEGRGPVDSLCAPSRVARRYAPDGQTLVSVTVLDAAEGAYPERAEASGESRPAGRGGPGAGDAAGLEGRVRTQLADWFGLGVGEWRLLRTYRITEALPAQSVGWLDPPRRPVRVAGLYVCGDHRDNASINGALESGRRAADAVLGDRSG